jgi:hypothetical protein
MKEGPQLFDAYIYFRSLGSLNARKTFKYLTLSTKLPSIQA